MITIERDLRFTRRLALVGIALAVFALVLAFVCVGRAHAADDPEIRARCGMLFFDLRIGRAPSSRETVAQKLDRYEHEREWKALGCDKLPPPPPKPSRTADDAAADAARMRPDGAKCELKRYQGGAIEVCDR